MKNDIRDYIKWLEKRIKETESEHRNVSELHNKIAKGGKLTAFKECYNYYITHTPEEILKDNM